MSLCFGDVDDRIEVQIFRREFKIVKADLFRDGKASIVREVGGRDIEFFQFCVDPHGMQDGWSRLNGGIFQNGDFCRARIEKEFCCFEDDRWMDAGDILFMAPCQQIWFQHDSFSGDATRGAELFFEDFFESRPEVGGFVVESFRVGDFVVHIHSVAYELRGDNL